MSTSPFLDAVLPLPAPPEARYIWAVVTQADPLRIKVDGDSAPLGITPDTLVGGLAVDQRVYCQIINRRLVVLGCSGGTASAVAATPSTLALRDAAGNAQGGTPVLPADWANKGYVDTAIADIPAGPAASIPATPSTVILRDASGKGGLVADPTDSQGIDTLHARDAAILAATAPMLAWERVVPSAVASTGSVATRDTATGVVTVPAGCTNVRLDGVIQAGYEIMVIVQGLASTASNLLQSLWMRMSEGGTPNSVAAYNEGGRWEQYDSTSGTYGANATSGFPVGHIVGPSIPFHSEIQLAPGLGLKHYFVFFKSHTGSYARTASGAGYTPVATTQFDGLYFYPGSGSFQAKIQVLRRKLMQ